jgi:hypothetical protein
MIVKLRRMGRTWIRSVGFVLATSWIPGAVRNYMFFDLFFYLGL